MHLSERLSQFESVYYGESTERFCPRLFVLFGNRTEFSLRKLDDDENRGQTGKIKIVADSSAAYPDNIMD